MIERIAPLSIGAVVGWLIFYFIRRYNKFTLSMLVATIAAILGGDGISSLAILSYYLNMENYLLAVGLDVFNRIVLWCLLGASSSVPLDYWM